MNLAKISEGPPESDVNYMCDFEQWIRAQGEPPWITIVTNNAQALNPQSVGGCQSRKRVRGVKHVTPGMFRMVEFVVIRGKRVGEKATSRVQSSANHLEKAIHRLVTEIVKNLRSPYKVERLCGQFKLAKAGGNDEPWFLVRETMSGDLPMSGVDANRVDVEANVPSRLKETDKGNSTLKGSAADVQERVLGL